MVDLVANILYIALQEHLYAFIDCAGKLASLATAAGRFGISHMAFDLSDEGYSPLISCKHDSLWDLTFSLRHATQAVILRVMSGSFRSPKDCRMATEADTRDILAA